MKLVPTEYNLNLRDFALAVSAAMNNSAEFRKLVKTEALSKFDGDYDVLLKHIMDRSVKAEYSSGLLRSDANYTVKELLGDYYRSAYPSNLRANGSSIIELLSSQYPNLQISVPVHADMLNEDVAPPVTFIPEENIDGVEQTIIAYKPDGTLMKLSSVIPPNEPIIVIGINERNGNIIQEYTVPPSPTSLTGIVNENGIFLSWTMPAGTNQSNVTGYKVYRKKGTANTYSLLAEVSGYANRSYTDVDITNNVTHSYYVVAYNSTEISDLSNEFTIMPSRPAAASEFLVVQESASLVKLAWTFAPNEYKLERTTSVGYSQPKYDFVFAPYRDPSEESVVRIHALRCNSVSACEGWLRGCPEFKIKFLGIDNQGKSSEIGQIEIRFSSRDDNQWNIISYNNGFVKNWKPGGSNWYDCISFYVIEDDGGGFVDNFSLNAQMNLKDFGIFPKTLHNALTTSSALSLPMNFLRSADDVMGYMYLNYYDNYDIMLHTSGCGGFDMKLCAHGDNVHEIHRNSLPAMIQSLQNYLQYHPL
ncbi:hypothetical protein FACS1894182_10050 [Bacteroidia bacterium]|nr:hypothetical protein FACS1894182_10050 [Bacteroidia bacterium]